MHSLDQAFKLYFANKRICFLKVGKPASSPAATPQMLHWESSMFQQAAAQRVPSKETLPCLKPFLHFDISTNQEALTAGDQNDFAAYQIFQIS